MAQPRSGLEQRRLQRRLVDQVAARDVDQESARLHPAELLGADQVLRVGGRRRQDHHDIELGQQGAEIRLLELRLDHLDIRVDHEHLHAQRDRELGEAGADVRSR